ncbi:MAG: class I SAM-dependent methyltransferase [Phenylobacterium sp.]|uniref:class I SAM-dependent methyltransferase n=1 Tax=Phenylobacterium sp. TaxID=1871053 RepID=UPI00271856CD|nr:class I SAM-dependent methyltransferase [Phenylobacterium sp.]MDO8901843.1 class I SAM-dependent methyltransferase [Phenylobacterium sp.]
MCAALTALAGGRFKAFEGSSMLKSNDSTLLVNRYGALAAQIYDIDKPLGALPDTAFHLTRFNGFRGEILEPACGTGRTLLPFLEAGLRIAGFDASPDMLDLCRSRCATAGFTPDLSLQRLEDFAYDRLFDAIVMPVGTFSLIDGFEAAMAVLRRFHDQLHPGGLLVLDLQGLSALRDDGADRRRWTTPDGDLLTLEGVRVKTDWAAQRIESMLRYERWRDHRLVEAHMEPMAQRCWGREEFALALGAAGFVEVSVTGNYVRGRPPRTGDQVLTFEARRP